MPTRTIIPSDPPPAAPAATLPATLRRTAAHVIDAGGTTRQALNSIGLTTSRRGQHFDVLLDGAVLFNGTAFEISCWLLGVDPEDRLATYRSEAA